MGISRRAVTAFSVGSRHRKAARITAWLVESGARTSLLVGCRPSLVRNGNIVESAVAGCTDVVASVDVEAGAGADLPWTHVVADGRDLPWSDGAVDFILANAVIEHVGGEADQRRFVMEQSRVAHSWVITTPNRWFPVESHTAKVLLHWRPAWRSSRPEFTRLLSRREFRTLLPSDAVMSGHWWSPTFTAFWSDHHELQEAGDQRPQGMRSDSVADRTGAVDVHDGCGVDGGRCDEIAAADGDARVG